MSFPKFQTKDKMVDLATGVATKIFQDWALSVQSALPIFQPLVLPPGNGQSNDTAAWNAMIRRAIAQGGATIIAPPGTYLLDTVTFPAGNVPITILGSGGLTILRRNSNLAPGAGMLDIFGSNVTLDSLTIDGNVTVPTGLFYNADFAGIGANDPMAASLTNNSSIWLHGPASNFNLQRVTIQHTGGYAVLIDSLSGEITDVVIQNCHFLNNRPHLFGFGGPAIYGSWTGGVFLKGDGRATNPGRMIKRFFMQGCAFRRNTGNQCWMHAYGLDEMHRTFLVVDNLFEDIGLDGVLAGAVIGGAVSQNVLHRIGYICATDTDDPVPRWLPNLQATAIDSSGLVIGVNYQGNSITSANGGGLDLDGHADSSLMGNLVRIPVVGDPDYDEDRIAISGIANAGSTSYGINLGNTSNTPQGGKNVTISGNTLLNLSAGGVRLYSARNCLVSANDIVAPDAPVAPPIALGPGGPGANQRSTGNVIKHNRFAYNPAVAAPFVFEDPSVAPFTADDVNYCFGNCPIIGAGGLATEFQKDPSSGSPTYLETPWFT